MKKSILIMLLISSLISLNGYGQMPMMKQSFTFTSSGTTFKIDGELKGEGVITIKPGVNGGSEFTIEKGKEYEIIVGTEYIVKGNFTVLNVSDNKLTSLDVSKLMLLKVIACFNNDFDVCALDNLFRSLPKRHKSAEANIFIAKGKHLANGIYDKCRNYIANKKSWSVKAIKESVSGSITLVDVKNKKPFGCPEGGDEEEIQSFTFTSSGTMFKIGTISVNSQSIKIDPKVQKADGTKTDIIETGVEYIIDADLKYTVSSLFSQLELDSNKLTSLDVSELIDLKALYCMSNELISLDVSKLTKLEALSCYDNELKSLDVTGLSKLTFIECFDNLFEVCDFDDLFKSLETRPVDEYASVTIASIIKDEEDSDYDVNDYNAYFTCRSYIANKKGWYVYYYNKYTDEIEIQNSEPFGCDETTIPENLASELDIKVFPNPVRDALQIESEEVIKQVSIFDISGKLLIKELVNDVNFNLQTADLNSGIYVLRIKTDKGVSNIKVIKE